MLKDETKSDTPAEKAKEGRSAASRDEFVRATAATAVDLLRPRFSTISDELSKLLHETEAIVRVAVAEALYEEVAGSPRPEESAPAAKAPRSKGKAVPGPPYAMPDQTEREVRANRERKARKGDLWVGPAGPGQGARSRPYVKVLEITGHAVPTNGPHKGVRKLTTRLVWSDSPAPVLAKSMLETSMKGDFRLLKKAPH